MYELIKNLINSQTFSRLLMQIAYFFTSFLPYKIKIQNHILFITELNYL